MLLLQYSMLKILVAKQANQGTDMLGEEVFSVWEG